MSKPRGHHGPKVAGKLRNNDWWKRCKRGSRKKAPDPNERMVGTGTTRFSRTTVPGAGPFRGGKVATRYSTDLIKLEVVRLYREGKSWRKIGRILGIPTTTIQNWLGQITLPVKPTSPYTLERMRRATELALKFYQARKFVKARECFYVACRQLDPRAKKASLDVYLSLEAIPCCPGFPLYREQSVQHRAELLYHGKRVRGADILDDVVLPVAPAPVALPREPSQLAFAPLVRMPVVDLAKFQSRRSKLGLPRLRL